MPISLIKDGEQQPGDEMSTEFSQVELEQTARRIDGYYVQRPTETAAGAFERAKAELIANLQRNIECAQAMEHANFTYRR